MKPNPLEEAKRWHKQAENDLEFARLGTAEGYYAQACFNAQQSAEKALNALLYLGGERFGLGHSIRELLERLLPRYPDLDRHKEEANRLDQHYITSRYPNGLPGTEMAPFEVFTQGQAQESVGWVEAILQDVKQIISEKSSGGV